MNEIKKIHGNTGHIPRNKGKKMPEVANLLSKYRNKKGQGFWLGRKRCPQDRKKMSLARVGRFTGINHPRWKGGVSRLSTERKTKQYTWWRNKIYKLFHWKCFVCEKHCRKGDIIAHHINSWLEKPQQRFDLENGIVLCRKCHLKVHKYIKQMRKELLPILKAKIEDELAH